MPMRRDVVIALLAGATALAASACTKATPKESREEPPKERLPSLRRGEHAGVRVVELFPRGATQRSPLVVAMHGRGDRPENWVASWQELPFAAHVVLPQAFEPFGDGFSWFPLRADMTEAEVAEALGAAEARLWPAITALADGRRVIVTGFSQGGMLSFAIAARHPEVVARALPVAGACPSSLLPRDGRRAAPVVAFHGTADGVIPFASGEATVAALVRGGSQATLRRYEGVGHSLPARMKDDLWASLGDAVSALARDQRP